MTLSSRPGGPFFSTPEQRLALARQRFFDEGVRPSGLVSEAVIQSWSRCLQARRHPRERISFEPVTYSRLHGALARHRELLAAASPELERLGQSLAGTRCRALLTGSDGVVIHASRSCTGSQETLMPIAARVGVNLAENVVGTTAPGIVAKTGAACTVSGSEHFFDTVQVMYCAAAPIRDTKGQLAGVLDLSIESQPFGFDAASVVALSAMAIENRLLQAQSEGLLVLHFHTVPSLLDGPFEGLAGVDERGRIAWINANGARIAGTRYGDVETQFGCTLHALLTRVHSSDAAPLTLPNGLSVWIRVCLHTHEGRRGHLLGSAAVREPIAPAVTARPEATPPPPAATLDEHNRTLVERTLAECGGNISQTARRLGVSRGLIYRRLRNGTAQRD
jgi:transcriptional regulator of acetoin/glycerol metabolism